MDDRLIYDIGANTGEDTDYYLAKGFNVVAVEASPVLVERLQDRFASQIAGGQLILVNKGILKEPGQFTFYRNLDNDHWSSFDPKYGTRQGTRYDEHQIECIPVRDLLAAYGVPRYMKIDVEGADREILNALSGRETPGFVSVEEYGLSALDDMKSLGYDLFFIAPQRIKNYVALPSPSGEGNYVEKKFTGYDSGPFGRDIGPWMNYDQARERFLSEVRSADGTYIGPEHEWHDLHATTFKFLKGQ